ncbi:LysR substrate-binding domain-containing protein [Azoarcus olearius]|uniref:Probable nodulation protein n=1 Tax=Azoarcus sp. (strain BH72) TaxID=418699 RepID=A1K391_AZOSB|nr:LysR substrate-binding domain-containing protein [Azoarcus olearius]CAL93296.1 probable nodulation protein [Azoarcus olearius]
MANGCTWDSLDAHLLRVLHVLLTEGSVSRAARRLNQSQPAVSTALKRLRDITGDKLLVRSRTGMTPTERGAELLEPVRIALEQMERIAAGPEGFEPANSRRVFNIATPDYLNALMLGDIVADIHRQAPGAQVAFHSMTQTFDYPRALESGELDLVIGNWPNPPEHLRTAPLFEDRMVVMMRTGHPLAGAPLTLSAWLAAEHVVPTSYSVGQRGVVDVYLARERLRRNVVAHVPYFHMAPYMVLQSDLVFTAPARFASHYADFLPMAVVDAPAELPRMAYYLLWHDRSQHSAECRWLRERIIRAARPDPAPAPLRRVA